jgi:hypothetical protein
MSIIAFSSVIGPVPISCVISEKHQSAISISEIPIETGASVTDHAYVMPKRVTLEVADANATATFGALTRFQESRVPFTLVTGLSVYSNMLVKAIDAERDASFSRVLRATVDLQEIIIVDTAYATAQPDGGEPAKAGQPGGKKSTQAGRPVKSRAGDAATADRVSGTVQRGDAPAKTIAPAANRSVLRQVFQ